ncbi:MAG: helix-turn-helix transcriptional regulator [Chloroflexi bacterium]|nr:MAG: helix-turn-helix transcriptional regulator [Chloroflexota bacterium]
MLWALLRFQIGATQGCPDIFETAGDETVRDLGGGGPPSGNGGVDRLAGQLTRRQAQILALAANGLSDKEIAKRLGITFRTVRTHFEKLFRDRGIRNRAQAIALWAGGNMLGRPQRPADECPYPKPFPPDFVDCPAYQATQMVTLDLSHRPLGSVMTCRHLEGRLMANTNYRWYGACVLGDVQARRRWSNAVGIDRLHDISTLRQEVSALSMPYVQQLLDLKNAPLGESPLAHTRQVRGVVDELMTKMTALLRERKPVLDALHLPLDACLRLLGIAIDRFVQQGMSEAQWEVPDEVLALFPDDVQAYFRPRQATGGATDSSLAGLNPAAANRQRFPHI